MTTRARLRAVHPVLMVRDVVAAIRFYELLGFTTTFRDSATETRYAGIRRDDVELHLQWHDAREWTFPVDRPTYRFVVLDVDTLHAEFAALAQPLHYTSPRDTPWGTREFHVLDLDGNGLQFYRDLT